LAPEGNEVTKIAVDVDVGVVVVGIIEEVGVNTED